jgi:hypothetical protein
MGGLCLQTAGTALSRRSCWGSSTCSSHGSVHPRRSAPAARERSSTEKASHASLRRLTGFGTQRAGGPEARARRSRSFSFGLATDVGGQCFLLMQFSGRLVAKQESLRSTTAPKVASPSEFDAFTSRAARRSSTSRLLLRRSVGAKEPARGGCGFAPRQAGTRLDDCCWRARRERAVAVRLRSGLLVERRCSRCAFVDADSDV